MPRAKAKAKSSKAPLIDEVYLRARLAHVDKTIAKQPAPYDKKDSPRDRLFAVLMQRIDCLQADRAEYQRILLALLQRPALLRVVAPALYASLILALQRAKLPHKPHHVGAVALAYIATVAAWRNDTTADLAKTMRACDRALAVLENITGWLPVAAAKRFR